jgi:uncharacterized protein (DUF1015 family)
LTFICHIVIIRNSVADVQPLHGLRYNIERIDDLSAVICPPYDVISPEEQLLYHRNSPYNVIRLEYGEELPEDSSEDNKYSRAATTIANWLREGILNREEYPAFYLVEHRFSYQDAVMSRFSLIARVRLEELSANSQIRPHEMTMRKPGEDRLNLLKSCHANISPIMGLFRHREEGIQSLFPDTIDKPAISAADRYGVAYAMWVVSDKKAVARVSDFFSTKNLYIADGHHRYETALAYSREQRAIQPSCTGEEAFNFVMITLTAAEDPNLIMMPTHRLVRRLSTERLARLKAELSAYFDEELLLPYSPASETLKGWTKTLKEQQGIAFGLYGLDGPHLCLLRAKREMMPPAQPSLLKDLDVHMLHQLVFRQILDIDSQEKAEDCLAFTRDGLDALSRVDSGDYQLAFLLNPTPISTMLSVADEAVRMPQKSTYFHPKTPAGLVINPLRDDSFYSAVL